ncbi:hypothetical protein CROQUDRAFT_156550 [Cronartium quercuum f. sp. fusiforme G11]|uniref:Secreted protein n=1 Tax=Cronartium quercuum f. sp. fusiforme G11 TaxID=708437 RepID=A0A9P6TFL7_9BASI|nr:hypothetical protein CROQUDRAFT_156550 [Cronartium quercuum f. sp. fusiforme G11]
MLGYIKIIVLFSILTCRARAAFGPVTCTYPKNKPVPTNCYFALQRYKTENGIIISPGAENQKSCYECQIKLSSATGTSPTIVSYYAAQEALTAILQGCPSGYGSVLISQAFGDQTTPTTLGVETGSGVCT